MRFPHSLGLLYSAFTYFCGFKVNSGDYKFMGLAPYGEPIYEDIIREKLLDIKEDGSFCMSLEYFDFQYGRAMTNKNFEKLFGGPRREPESEITRREMNIAASAQKVVEDIILKIVKHAKLTYGKNIDNLVMAGGVALNCVANGKIKNSDIFSDIWIQPAAGDSGGSLGAALYASYSYAGIKRKVNISDSQKGSFLGPAYSQEEITSYLDSNNYVYHLFDENNLYITIAKELSSEKVIGLFQGRMEFGPRALGGRSIIADARSESMQVKLNQKIKYRESFRPFAPSVLREDVSEYFELDDESPYMLLVENVKENEINKFQLKNDLDKYKDNTLEIVKQKRSDIPAVTHVDYSARIQTVTEERNPYYYKVLKEFKRLTGYGVIVNTSFNVRGEPIVCTPENAYECFMRTDMDVLVLENCILYKDEQRSESKQKTGEISMLWIKEAYMDKNKKEKELFSSWHEKVSSDENRFQFPEIDKKAKSYFIKREETDYLKEYNFETLPQIKSELDNMWKDQGYMQEIIKAVLAASMKNKPSLELNKKP